MIKEAPEVGTPKVEESQGKEASVSEREPRINLTIFSSAHRTREDARGLKELFEKADIYIPEIAGVSPAIREYYDVVARDGLDLSRLSPEERREVFTSFRASDYEMVAGSKKPFLFVDVPKDSEWMVRYRRVHADFYAIAKRFISGKNFDELLRQYSSAIEKWADLQKEREEYIRETLKRELPRIVKEHPALRDRQELNVLMQLGAEHTTFYRAIKRDMEIAGGAARRVWNEMPFVFGYPAELMRRYYFKKSQRAKEGITDELFARTLFEEVLYEIFGDVISDSAMLVRVSRHIAGQLGLK